MWLNLYIFSTSVLLEAQVKTELPGQQEVLSTNIMYKTKQQVLQWENKPPTALYIKSIYGRKGVAICVLTENIRATKKPTHEGCDMDPYDVTEVRFVGITETLLVSSTCGILSTLSSAFVNGCVCNYYVN